MESGRFLKIVIVILLLINISTLAMMWLHHPAHDRTLPPPPGAGGPLPQGRAAADFLIHTLHFDEKQTTAYEKLIEAHRAQTHSIREAGRDYHKKFFDLLHNNAPDTLKARHWADSIAYIQSLTELATFRHFMQVRALCTPAQQKTFDSVINDALHMMMPPPPGPPDHERGQDGPPPAEPQEPR